MRLLAAWLIVLTCGASLSHAAPPHLSIVEPAAVGLNAEKLQQIDAIVQRGLDNQQMPGAVVLVARQGKIAWLKAYGNKRVQPAQEAMTTDTVFDLASITKPVATATSVMKLVEQGKIDLSAPVVKYLPEMANNGKEQITVEQLLTHQAGFITDNALRDYQDGPEKAWERLFALKLVAEPATKFIYSDVSFELLGKLVERVSGQDQKAFAHDQLFAPLGLQEIGYLPGDKLRARAAPTQERDGHWMQGEVHDPRSHLLGGIAGHAGLFSTAEDLAVYAQMLLNRGEYAGVRVLEASTIENMTTARTVPGGGKRGLGWDMRTGFSSNRGAGMSDAAYGHGGFTGTVLWIDPQLDLFYIFLSNRVHPNGKGNVNKLAGELGAVVVDSIVK